MTLDLISSHLREETVSPALAQEPWGAQGLKSILTSSATATLVRVLLYCHGQTPSIKLQGCHSGRTMCPSFWEWNCCFVKLWQLTIVWLPAAPPKIWRRMLGGVFRLFSLSMESSMELVRRITSKAHLWSKPKQQCRHILCNCQSTNLAKLLSTLRGVTFFSRARDCLDYKGRAGTLLTGGSLQNTQMLRS